MNVLLGVTGSIAAKLTPKLQKELFDSGFNFKTVYTESAKHFTRNKLSSVNEYYDEDEWKYYEEENKVLHIDLVKWADVMIIAPCTANTLSKIYTGICDNLLTCCVRAWPTGKRQIILVPAMNCEMFDKPLLAEQMFDFQHTANYVWIGPSNKKLFCGDTGIGAMANIEDIMKAL